MRCSFPPEELSAYLDGELGRAGMAAVEEHLCVCDSCRNELSALRGLSRTLGGAESLDPGVSVQVRVARRLAMTEDSPAFTCARMQVSMSAMLDGEISGEESLRLEEHLAACPACASELTVLEKVSDTLHALPEVELPLGLDRRIRTALAREEQGFLSWRLIERWFQPRLAPGMATALAGATLVVGFWLGRMMPNAPALAPVATQPAKPGVTITRDVASGNPTTARSVVRTVRRAQPVRAASPRQPVEMAVREAPAPAPRAVTPRPASLPRTLPLPAPAPAAPVVIGAARPVPDVPEPVIETPTPAPDPEPEAPAPAAPVVASRAAPEPRASIPLPSIEAAAAPQVRSVHHPDWWRKAPDDVATAADALRGHQPRRAVMAGILKGTF